MPSAVEINKSKSLFSENSSRPVPALHAENVLLLFSRPHPSLTSQTVSLLVLLLLGLSTKAFPVLCEAIMRPTQCFSPVISMQPKPSAGGEGYRDRRRSDSRTWSAGGRRHGSAAQVCSMCCSTSLSGPLPQRTGALKNACAQTLPPPSGPHPYHPELLRTLE